MDNREKMNFGKFCPTWHPWYGCNKVSEGCWNCYIFPKNKFRNKFYNLYADNYPAGTFITVGIKTDVFLEEADELRPLLWTTIKNNPNLIFSIFTKRIERVSKCLPEDWGDGYNNVIIQVSVENQKQANIRLPQLIDLKAKHKWVSCSPLLEAIDLSTYLSSGEIESVVTTGERDACYPARPTHYDWVKQLSEQCIKFDIRFNLIYCGDNFIMPDGIIVKSYPKRWCQNPFELNLNLYHYKPITFELKDITKTF